jgi:hypothetical protein
MTFMTMTPGKTFLAAVAGLVLLASLAIFLAESRRNTTFAAGTPQAVVKEYLEAIATDDKVMAFSFVADESD